MTDEPRHSPPDWTEEEGINPAAQEGMRSDIGASNRAATPTKIGEFLASGRPVVVNAGLGDLDELLARYDCGVVMPDNGDIGLDAAADELGRLLSDAGTPERCRALAEEHFNLDLGVDQLLLAYQQAVGAPPKALPRPPGSVAE